MTTPVRRDDHQSGSAYPGLWGSLSLLVLLVLVTLTAGLVSSIFNLERIPAVAMLVQGLLPTALIAWYAWRRRSRAAHALLALPRLSAVTVAAVAITLAAFWIVLYQATAHMTALMPVPQSILDAFERRVAGPWLPMSGVLVAMAYAEEVLFRGVILAGLLERHGAVPAILISACAFGLVHAVPWAILSAFLGGLLLGWIYYRSRSIMLCALVHVAHNFGSHAFVQAVGGVVGPEGFALDQRVLPLLPLWVVLLATVILLTGGLLVDGRLRALRGDAPLTSSASAA